MPAASLRIVSSHCLEPGSRIFSNMQVSRRRAVNAATVDGLWAFNNVVCDGQLVTLQSLPERCQDSPVRRPDRDEASARTCLLS